MAHFLTVTPNPAYDVTYVVPGVELGKVHRVAEVQERAGGKGINVARVLGQFGEDVHALGFGDAGFAAALDADGISNELIDALPRVRRTLVVHGAETTAFWERGHELEPGADDALAEQVEAALVDARGLVVSGSLPGGADPGLPARLARLAVAAGVPVVVDADGEALRLAARVPGVVLMPNADEVRALAPDTDDWLDACRSVVDAGVRAVIATRGAEGMTAVTADEVRHATPARRVDGNPTGAGDAAAAAVISQLARDSDDWHTLLVDAVATSGAAVVAPVAGQIDAAVRASLRTGITTQRDEERT
ncbi:hexose kinase [Nocardioidaceae bacterium SCSIO 66511]|nr:hexose kinase [Nocardioidaceae bacterium SCSIO 66511]